MEVTLDAAHFNELLNQVEELNSQIGRPELIEMTEEPQEASDFKAGLIKRQQLSEAATNWLAAESVNKQIRNVFAFTSLSRWLERESWTPREALAILAGLDPAKSSIEWPLSNSTEATTSTPIFRDVFFLADWTDTFTLPHSYTPGQPKSLLLTIIEDSRELGFDEAAQEFFCKAQEERDSALEQLNSLRWNQVRLRKQMLACIYQRWNSSIHDTESSQSPKFFIKWAKDLGFQIEWLSWARRENLLDRTNTSQDKTAFSAGIRAKGSSEENWAPDHTGPVPLTTTEIADCFSGFRWKTPSDGRKQLGKKPAWLRNCIAIPGSQGKLQIRWYPVEIGAKLVRDRYAKASQIRSCFIKQPRLREWLELWKDYEDDFLSTD